MKYINLITLALLIGCASTKKKIQPHALGSLLKKDLISLSPKNIEILLGDKKSKLDYPHILKVSLNQVDYYLPIDIDYNKKENNCPYKNITISANHDSFGPLPIKAFDKIRLKSLCNYKKPKAKALKEVVLYKMQKQMGILQPMIHGTEITIRQYGSKRNQLKRYGLILENLDTFKKNNSIVSTYTENDFSISDNHAFNNFTEIIKKTNRDHALKTLLFNSLIGHKDYQYRIPDLLGKVAFNQNAPLGFKGLIYYNTDKTSLLSAANFDDSYFMKYQESKIKPLIKEKIGCEYHYCLSQFMLIQKWRSFYKKAELKKSINSFVKNKNILQQIITESPMDNEDKISSLKLLRSFYGQIEGYDQVPVITEKAVPIYSSTDLKYPCGDENPGLKMFVRAPAGLPAFVLEEEDSAKKVLLFDTRDGSMTNPLTQESCVSKDHQNWLLKEATISPNWPIQ